MKGVNEFRLNQATMMEAMECWLETQMASGKCPTVTNVSFDSSEHEFVVKLDSEKAP